MWLNLVNLHFGNVDEAILNNLPRVAGCIICIPSNVMLRPGGFDNFDGWVVQIDATRGTDPKVHFTDFDKARKFYDLLCMRISESAESDYTEIDVLEHGAL